MRCNNERVNELERRVEYLEERMKVATSLGKHPAFSSLVAQYGRYVTKADAAKILGVCRATIYQMIQDGRLEGKMGGSKVSVESIERFIESPSGGGKLGKKHKSKEDGECELSC